MNLIVNKHLIVFIIILEEQREIDIKGEKEQDRKLGTATER